MITLILAHDEAGGIGYQNGLPWGTIKEDMRRFRKLTTDHIVIMGRKTLESIGKPLPNRINVVISRNKDYAPDGVLVFHSFEEALVNLSDFIGQEMFVIGGAEIYNLALPYAKRIYYTLVPGEYPADTFWKPDLSGWIDMGRTMHISTVSDPMRCFFGEYRRKEPDKTMQIENKKYHREAA